MPALNDQKESVEMSFVGDRWVVEVYSHSNKDSKKKIKSMETTNEDEARKWFEDEILRIKVKRVG